jgi:hypothetical protein
MEWKTCGREASQMGDVTILTLGNSYIPEYYFKAFLAAAPYCWSDKKFWYQIKEHFKDKSEPVRNVGYDYMI